jgi:hypothetical protein
MRFLFLLAFLICQVSYSQVLPDSTHRKYRPRFVLDVDFRNSFIRNSPVTIYGGSVGIKNSPRSIISLGYYTLTSKSKTLIKNNNKLKYGISDEVNLHFVSLGYTYIPLDGKRWKLSLPFEIGMGESEEQVLAPDQSKVLLLRKTSIVPVQIGLITEYKATRWFGAFVSVGYREVISKRMNLSDDFDGLYYAYGVNLYLGKIYEDLKK